MRVAVALLPALLLLSASLTPQVAALEDLYWEGEEDSANEFLEVKDDIGIGGLVKRFKREFDFFNLWGSSSSTTTTPPPPPEPIAIASTTETDDVLGGDDVDTDGGSGSHYRPDTETELREKTLRVTFVVNQPYQAQYSNRDSPQFKSFSMSLADAVNRLFDSLPGTQRASLVRIQSRISDEFTCKVTLEILTTGYDDTGRITDILHDHIRSLRKLGDVAVSDSDFSAIVIDPGSSFDLCAADEFRCEDGRCVAGYARCNKVNECSDGSDEANCPFEWGTGDDDQATESDLDVNEPDVPDQLPTSWLPWDNNRGDNNGLDELTTRAESDHSTTEIPIISTSCQNDELRCDETRCVPLIARCNGYNECDDGADEANCEETCGVDDFRCNSGKCIEGSRRCDRVVDCPGSEDELDCDCRVDEFRCVQDGSCIEARKRCDGVSHCRDNSDEDNCACGSDQWQCDRGSCIKRSKRCDGRVDCPTDRSDERNCLASYFRCRTGKLIPVSLRCNRDYDCPRGDYSDEQNCPCGDGDFQCGNGHCIPASKRCDRTHDCQDRSDEKDCIYGTTCMAYEYKCTNGECVDAEAACNGTIECPDGSDERNCPCRRDQFQCRDGRCISLALRCNGRRDCQPYGEDEKNCHTEQCPPDTFTCYPGSVVRCATRCDKRAECASGEDEENCEECNHECDGRCLDDALICNGRSDCRDGSDELDCDSCDRADDFRCRNGECLNAAQRCNGVPECSDLSDEEGCSETVTPAPRGCLDNQFQCRNGTCINNDFYCDGHNDCNDNSDEENCPPECSNEDFRCASGQCILATEYCDGYPQCDDGSDESSCPTTRPWFTTTPYPLPPPRPTRPPYYTTTSFPFPPPPPDNRGQCNRNQWRCENGPCIDTFRRCDGHVDCPLDSSDEFDCPPGSPIALNLQTYPDAQSVRNVQAGGDVVFQCRDEGPLRAPVRWVREGGRPLKPGSTDRNGRLEMIRVSMGDSGTYICQAPRYLGTPGSELRVQLTVENTPTATQSPAFPACQPWQATCGNGQCIAKSAICDGKRDCSDGSDEDNCNQDGMCEPNQFQCANRKCVLKTWLCDFEDDCGDRSDEANCGSSVPRPGECLPVEFKCDSGSQCVPKSFHCDGQSDCLDGSDEIGCAPVHISKPPQPANLRLNPGDVLTLVCEAVGVPTPLISWRLNWGHVPQNCTSTSERGVGVLTCYNMQPEHSGAYSCEAINNKGTTFAAPDSIVYVNRTDNVCPVGFFNNEARTENECIRCFCFGESTQCRSADLFTYNMPTPLGEGGTRLVGVKQSFNGDVQIDSQPMTDQYYYQPLRNGATVTKLAKYGSSWPYTSSNVHPYLSLPETYNGNQLTSYGGHIRYRLASHSPRFGSDDGLPDVIIKGKHRSLVHHHRGDKSRHAYIEVRLTPENWQKTGPSGVGTATREDLMMALDNIEMILLRADLNNAGVNITDFNMESAQHISVGLGPANLVEECTCPPGYEGLSCQKCASGFVRQQSGPWLGNCVPNPQPCPPGTYGDPSGGYGCRPCPCPLTNRDNNFARTCSVGPRGNVICDCLAGYGGDNCEYCEPGYVGNPMVPGDSCRYRPQKTCNPVGTLRTSNDECQCKDNVQGRYCDQCRDNSFFLSEEFRQGCAQCFCSGVSQTCRSSNLRRKTTTARFNTPQIVDQLSVYNSAPTSLGDNVKYNTPVHTDLRASLDRGLVSLSEYDRSRPSIYYWSLPIGFAGDKVTSYGGYLTYTLTNVPTSSSTARNNAPDVQLLSENRLNFHYFGNFAPSSDGTLNASVQFLEKGWQRQDGKEISREHFLLALADVKAILIKATYSSYSQLGSLESASIETAEETGNGPQALHVEQCVCPEGYVGTSCEDCAPGFTRSSRGLYLEHCDRCDCNDHSSSCHPETGVCYDCRDNTAGDNCELCKPGYQKDPYGNCVGAPNPSPCSCDPRGEAGPCDSRTGTCQCKQNVEGDHCDVCRPGTFGLDQDEPLGCLACYCSGVTTDCHEASHFSRIEMAAPIFGDDYGGYTLTNLQGTKVIDDQFLPDPNESELTYTFPYPPDEELYWSLPVFPGNRLLSYGGTLSLTQKFNSGGYFEVSSPGVDVVLVGDSGSIYWTNPKTVRSEESLNTQVPLRAGSWFLQDTATPASRNDFMSILKNLRRVLVRATIAPNIISTSIADVSMDTASEIYSPQSQAKGIEVCMCPQGYSGNSCESCKPGWYRDLQFDTCKQCNCNGHDCQQNAYNEVVCTCRPPYTGRDCSTVGGDSSTNNGTTRPPPPESTVVVRITSPTIKIEEVGGSVTFKCQAQSRMTSSRLPVQWTKDGGELPQGRSQVDTRSGLLLITNLQLSDSGKYICQTSDGISTAQAIATLKVPGNDMTLPVVQVRPVTSEYYEGENIVLECDVTGNPAPRITWQRVNNYPLPRSMSAVEGRFIIENARESDSGEYRCIATNAAGSTDRVAVVTVRPKPSGPTREKLTVSPTSPTINEGQTTRIICSGTASIPADYITWVREDRQDFQPNVRADNGILYIDYALPENRGVYTCQVALPDVAPVSVLLTVVPSGTPSPSDDSNITVSKNTVRIPQGGSDSVDCSPLGYPQPIIKWRKYEGEFGPGTSQRDNTLIITNAQEEDGGYYLCEGNVAGREPAIQIYVYVEIEKRERPRVEIWPQGEQAVALGSQFELHCRVMGGVPAPDVTWDRNGGRPLSSHVQIQKHNVLRFERIEVNDEGEYTCVATNVAGTASASAVLKVRSPPEITIMPSSYNTLVVGDSATIECRANGYPEPLVSIKTSRDLREVVPQAPGMAVLRISDATERDEGDYICTATSAAGTIDEQFVVRVGRGDSGFLDGGSGEGEFDPFNPDNNVPASVIAIEGEVAKIECNVSDGFEVQWRRTDRPMQSNAEPRGTVLYIHRASKSDSGQYECSVINSFTHEIPLAAHTSLLVVSAPRITLQPKTQTVHPGQSPTVECIVNGDDIIDVQWRGNSRPPSRRVEMRGSSLVFHQIEVEDAGKYECFVRSRYANATGVAEVIVTAESNHAAESHENEQFAYVGSSVSLNCKIPPSADDVSSIRWSKDGRDVPRHLYAGRSLDIRQARKSDSGHYICIIQDRYGRNIINYINLHIQGPREDAPKIVKIDQPRRSYRVGENVEVSCTARSRDTEVTWERYGSNQQRQYVETRNYRGGSMFVIRGVQESDAGVYRCTGTDPYGRSGYEDFNLEVIPVTFNPSDTIPGHDVVHTARLGQSVDMPCNHDMELPVSIEWRKDYSSLPPDVRKNEPIIHLERVTEADAGTYVCRVSNMRNAVETRAILRVEGVVPRFDGYSWIALPTLKDAFQQFDIEISFNPSDPNGLILYNSQHQGRTGDFLALQLVDGVPEFSMDPGSGVVLMRGDRPLQLNTWHTIRIQKTKTQVTMDVDNMGPFLPAEPPRKWDVLELEQNLYIGGVPDFTQLPDVLSGATGFVGCVSMLILGREEKNIMIDNLETNNINECDTCSPNQCLNNGVCQEARNERGFMCLCQAGFAGLTCDRTGEACRPGLCGPGRCTDTAEGYKCICPVTYTGRNCDVKQSIEYPAFTGSAYLAIKAPTTNRLFQMSMKLKPTAPVTDGIIVYSAENARGYGAFVALTVHDGKLEYRYDVGDGSAPVVLTANRSLPANEWTNVAISRMGAQVSLKINLIEVFEKELESPFKNVIYLTPIFVGGVDESIVLNNNTGVTGGFNGCIKDVMVINENVDIVNSSIQSANVQECSNYGDRGDIPEVPCDQCRNGGYCTSPEASVCTCPPGFGGTFCEHRVPLQSRRPVAREPCAAQPCRHGGTCKPDRSTQLSYSCDCPLGFAGVNCQMPLELLQSVGFNGNGYLELPSRMLSYNRGESEPAWFALAFHTTSDGVLLYQREAISNTNYGDYILLRVQQGRLVLDWDFGSGLTSIVEDSVVVNDGERHTVHVKLNRDSSVVMTVDNYPTKTRMTTGISNLMNADSNIYIGGIPEPYNFQYLPGLTGCIEQVELPEVSRSFKLSDIAVAGRNTQRCRDSRH